MNYQCSICKAVFADRKECMKHEEGCYALNERRVFMAQELEMLLTIAATEKIYLGVKIPAQTQEGQTVSVPFELCGTELDVQKNTVLATVKSKEGMQINVQPIETKIGKGVKKSVF